MRTFTADGSMTTRLMALVLALIVALTGIGLETGRVLGQDPSPGASAEPDPTQQPKPDPTREPDPTERPERTKEPRPTPETTSEPEPTPADTHAPDPTDGQATPRPEGTEAPGASPTLPTADPTVTPEAAPDPTPYTPADEPAGEELVGRRTANSQTFRQEDGSLVTEFSSEARFYQPDGSDEWVPIDVGFGARRADGSFLSSKAPAKVEANLADDPDGFLHVRGSGYHIRFHLPDAIADDADGQRPLKEGGSDLAAQWPDLLPGSTDLLVLPRADGVKTFLVLKQPPVSNRFTFLVDSDGLEMVARPDRSVAFTAPDGSVHGVIPAPYAVDSSWNAELGSGETTTEVTLEVGRRDGQDAVTIVVDPAFLESAVYPVYVDPTLTVFPFDAGGSHDTFVYEGSPNTNFNDYQRPDSPYYHELWLGEKPGSGGMVARALIKFYGLDDVFEDAHVTSAVLRVYPYHQAASPKTTWIKRLTETWDQATVDWNDQPNAASLVAPDPVSISTSMGTTAEFDVTATVQAWADGSLENYGFQLHENGNDSTYWKRLISKEQASTDSPRLRVWWVYPIATVVSPTADTWTSSRVLTWTYSDNNPSANYPQSHYEVEVSTDEAFEGPISGTDGIAVGSASTWTVPAGDLASGNTYFWRVRVKDGFGWSGWATQSFHYSTSLSTTAQDAAALTKASQVLGVSSSALSFIEKYDGLANADNASFRKYLIESSTDFTQLMVFVNTSTLAAITSDGYLDLVESQQPDSVFDKFEDSALEQYNESSASNYALLVNVEYSPPGAGMLAAYPTVTYDDNRKPETTDPELYAEVLEARLGQDAIEIEDAAAPLLAAASDASLDVQALEHIPLVYVRATSADILELAERPDVVAVYGTSPMESGTVSSARYAVHLNDVPSSYRGGGIRVGIIEFGNTGTLGGALPLARRSDPVRVAVSGGRLTCSYVEGAASRPAQELHARQVAAMAVGEDTGAWTGPGAAPEATLVAVSGDISDEATQPSNLNQDADFRMAKAIDCSIARADVFNMSYIQNRPGWHGLNVAIDYASYHHEKLFTVIAGNRPGHCGNNVVRAPGSAWNALTIGGMQDAGVTSGNRSGDDIWRSPGSSLPAYCWGDPANGPFAGKQDHMKPDLLAPATGLEVPNTDPANGTSLAAPIVAGIAARVLGAAPSLKVDVEALRAVLLASGAGHPAMEPGRLRPGSRRLDYEGLGAVRADWAVDIARRRNDSGFSSNRSWNESVGACAKKVVEFDVPANRDVRFVVTWSAHPPKDYDQYANPNRMPASRITSNLNLTVRKGGSKVKSSSSLNGNVEWVEFSSGDNGGSYTAIIQGVEMADGHNDCSRLEEVGWAWVAS